MAINVQSLLAKLQSIVSPKSTMSQAGNMDAYQKHVIQAQISGQKPMTFEEFQRLQQGQQPLQPGLLGQ